MNDNTPLTETNSTNGMQPMQPVQPTQPVNNMQPVQPVQPTNNAEVPSETQNQAQVQNQNQKTEAQVLDPSVNQNKTNEVLAQLNNNKDTQAYMANFSHFYENELLGTSAQDIQNAQQAGQAVNFKDLASLQYLDQNPESITKLVGLMQNGQFNQAYVQAKNNKGTQSTVEAMVQSIEQKEAQPMTFDYNSIAGQATQNTQNTVAPTTNPNVTQTVAPNATPSTAPDPVTYVKVARTDPNGNPLFNQNGEPLTELVPQNQAPSQPVRDTFVGKTANGQEVYRTPAGEQYIKTTSNSYASQQPNVAPYVANQSVGGYSAQQHQNHAFNNTAKQLDHFLKTSTYSGIKQFQAQLERERMGDLLVKLGVQSIINGQY